MSQVDFLYGYGDERGSGAHSVSIFADRLHLRQQLHEDVEAAGFSVRCSASLDELTGQRIALDQAVLVDCPVPDDDMLDMLARLAEGAARGGPQLVVSTNIDALDRVFACCDGTDAEILVDPRRAERIVALGRILAGGGGQSVRELAQGDRMMLLRLAEQVGRLASQIDGMGVGQADGAPTTFTNEAPFASEAPGWIASATEGAAGLQKNVRQPLPDPRLVRQIIRHRQLRTRYFEGEYFADPAWDMLLDLTAARAEHVRVSVTSLCIASGVPPTTALRWISQMTDAGMLERVEDDSDRRRAFIVLADRTADAMARYFAEIGRGAAQLA